MSYTALINVVLAVSLFIFGLIQRLSSDFRSNFGLNTLSVSGFDQFDSNECRTESIERDVLDTQSTSFWDDVLSPLIVLYFKYVRILLAQYL